MVVVWFVSLWRDESGGVPSADQRIVETIVSCGVGQQWSMPGAVPPKEISGRSLSRKRDGNGRRTAKGRIRKGLAVDEHDPLGLGRAPAGFFMLGRVGSPGADPGDSREPAARETDRRDIRPVRVCAGGARCTMRPRSCRASQTFVA